MSILKEFKEHCIELVGAVLLKWKYEANNEATTREQVIADATQLMNESIHGWDIELEYKQEIIAQKDQRIAELEAEVAMATKLTKGFRQVGIGWEAWNGRDTLVVRYWPNRTKIKQQSATDFEEGEG